MGNVCIILDEKGGLILKTEIWVAVHTPFKEDGEIDEEGIRSNVERYYELGVSGVFCNGFMGENWSLSVDEKKKIMKLFVEAAAGRIRICTVGTEDSLEKTVDLGLYAKSVGVDYVALIVPKTGMEKDEEFISYFSYLFKEIDMPFVVFNSVTPTGSVLKPNVFAKLCEDENLKILKTTASQEENNALRAVASSGVKVSDPHEEFFFKNMVDHHQTILFADPEPYLYQTPDFRPIEKYVQLVEDGKIQEAQGVFNDLQPIREVYNKWVIKPFYEGVKTNAALKKFAETLGMVGGSVRKPLTPLEPSQAMELEQEILAAMDEVKLKAKGWPS